MVHRAGTKYGNADGLSRMLEEGPDWMPGEKEKLFGSCPEPIPSRRPYRKQINTECRLSQWSVMKPMERRKWKQSPGERTPSEISALQKEDEAIAQVFYWASLESETGDMPSLGTNLVPKDQAIQYGLEALAYWSRWNELSIHGGVLYKKRFPEDDSRPILQTVVPAAGRREILNQLHSSQSSGGHFAVEKTLSRIHQQF